MRRLQSNKQGLLLQKRRFLFFILSGVLKGGLFEPSEVFLMPFGFGAYWDLFGGQKLLGLFRSSFLGDRVRVEGQIGQGKWGSGGRKEGRLAASCRREIEKAKNSCKERAGGGGAGWGRVGRGKGGKARSQMPVG